TSKYRPLVDAAIGLGTQYAVLLPYSREHESEADHIGLFYMAKAGYDPIEAVNFWANMGAGASGGFTFLSTHPSPESRLAELNDWLPEAIVYFKDRTRPLPASLVDARAAAAEDASRAAQAPEGQRPSYTPGFWYQIKMSARPGPTTFRFDRTEPCGS